jgi:hypothetical protein
MWTRVAVRPGPRVVVGPNFRQRTLRQPTLETQIDRTADDRLSEALRIVRQAVGDWRQAAAADPEEGARRDRELGQFERLAGEVQRANRR